MKKTHLTHERIIHGDKALDRYRNKGVSILRITTFSAIFTALFVYSTIVPVNAATYTKIDMIRAAARQFIVAHFKNPHVEGLPEDIKITVKSLDPRLRLAACASELEVYMAPGTRLVGHSTVGVRCDTPKAWSLFVPVYIERLVPVVTLRRALRRGETLDASNILVKKRAITSIPASYLKTGDAVVDQIASRDIVPGVVLTQHMFKPRKLVRRGDRVVLSMKSGTVAVRVAGIAMADGARGDRIKVKNLSSKRLVDGTVSAANTVLVGNLALQ